MTPLSEALRERTAEAHRLAEEARFIDDLMSGSACRGAFAALARQLFEVYTALEGTIDAHYADHPMVAPVLDDRLRRVDALSRDLEALRRSGRFSEDVLPATAAYATELRERHSPEMMLANHYVRYLGDLSGGQIIARMVGTHYQVTDDGLGFYRFDGIEKIKPYRDGYRAILDSIVLTDQQRERVLDEAQRAFELNRGIFLALTANRDPEHLRFGVAS